jgi:hypothetical protein
VLNRFRVTPIRAGPHKLGQFAALFYRQEGYRKKAGAGLCIASMKINASTGAEDIMVIVWQLAA